MTAPDTPPADHFRRFITLVAILVGWAVLGTLVCSYWPGIGLIPEEYRTCTIRDVVLPRYCLLFWMYLPFVTPFGNKIDRAIVQLRTWLLPPYSIQKLEQDRTYCRLFGLGFAVYFFATPHIYTAGDLWRGENVAWSAAVVIWVSILSPYISWRLHNPKKSDEDELK